MDRARRTMAFRTAAQDHRIAGLERKRTRIRGDIGPALIDHRNDTERHAHALDRHAIGTRPRFGDLAVRVGLAPHRFETLSHGLDALIVERKPVEEGGRRTRGLGLRQILAIGSENVGLARANGSRHCGKRLILFRRRGECERARCAFRPAADVAHRRGDVGSTLDGFERRGHRIGFSERACRGNLLNSVISMPF
jgi:hypothetical protein